MTEASRYPLAWPVGWPRTAAHARKPTTFTETKAGPPTLPLNAGPNVQPTFSKRTVTVSFVTARDRLWAQLGHLDVMYDAAILSTNVQLNSFGQPRADRRVPDDPGVAVYFELHGKDRVLACDKWDSVAGNMAAIANHIDAIRRVDRYGVGTLDQAFAGYDALPAPSADNRAPWRATLGVRPDIPVTADDVRLIYRARAKACAADEAKLLELNLARDAAMRELGAI